MNWIFGLKTGPTCAIRYKKTALLSQDGAKVQFYF
jgi:hypothetical protein